MKYTETEVRELVNFLLTVFICAFWLLEATMWIVLIVTDAQLPIFGHCISWSWSQFAIEGGGGTIALAGFLYLLWKDKIRVF